MRSGLLWIIYYSTSRNIGKLCMFCIAREAVLIIRMLECFFLRLDRHEKGHFRLLYQVLGLTKANRIGEYRT